jgi:hypothetical protein
MRKPSSGFATKRSLCEIIIAAYRWFSAFAAAGVATHF